MLIGNSSSDGGTNGSSKGDSGKMGNTIGQLQELCVREGCPMPTYDLASVDGQPHQRNFKITVHVGKMTNNGEGTSKKDAKRDAAAKMMLEIQGEISLRFYVLNLFLTSGSLSLSSQVCWCHRFRARGCV